MDDGKRMSAGVGKAASRALKPGSEGVAIGSHRAALADRSEPELRAILEDRSAPVTRRIAARQLLVASLVSFDKSGRIDPEPGKAGERLDDRAFGRPVQPVEQIDNRSLEQVRGEIVGALSADPSLILELVSALVAVDPSMRQLLAARLELAHAAAGTAGVAPPQAAPDRPDDPPPCSSLATKPSDAHHGAPQILLGVTRTKEKGGEGREVVEGEVVGGEVRWVGGVAPGRRDGGIPPVESPAARGVAWPMREYPVAAEREEVPEYGGEVEAVDDPGGEEVKEVKWYPRSRERDMSREKRNASKRKYDRKVRQAWREKVEAERLARGLEVQPMPSVEEIEEMGVELDEE